ncbi:MAG TPA: IS1595 family transposase [Pirellulales bacterium]|jgi:transposase-like protein
MDTKSLPKTLVEAIRHFSDPQVCHDFMVSMRWSNGEVTCPRCDCKKVGFIKTRRTWQCKGCQKQFSVKLGTIFEDSPLGMDKWLPAVWLIANSKNGVSSHELARSLGVTQKTAWFMLHRIRLAMQTGSFNKFLAGEVEVDETFIGGKARNMHPGKRKAKGTGTVGKAVVMGLLERHGEVRTKVMPNTKRRSLQPEVRANVYRGAEVFTDALKSYEGLSDEYAHQVIDHAECYVDGKIHTNGLENFWSLLKRGIKGTYVSVQPFHLFRYLDEQTFRFNKRQGNDCSRFLEAMIGIIGKRVTFKELTATEG